MDLKPLQTNFCSTTVAAAASRASPAYGTIKPRNELFGGSTAPHCDCVRVVTTARLAAVKQRNFTLFIAGISPASANCSELFHGVESNVNCVGLEVLRRCASRWLSQ